MTLEVLVAAMEEYPEILIKRMNLNSDGIIINQGDYFQYSQIACKEHTIRIYNMEEKGVGLSRNTAIMRAKAEISLISDSDLVYVDDYEQKIIKAFEENPKADILLFHVNVAEDRRTYSITKKGRVHWYNCGRYPAYSIAIRTKVLHSKNICFSLLFGGGAPYSAGEDSLFLMDCIRSGMKIIKVPVCIGSETPGESTWFVGFNEKFFYDRGVLYYHLYKNLRWLMGFRFIWSKRKEMCKEISWLKAWNIMCCGMKEACKHGEKHKV